MYPSLLSRHSESRNHYIHILICYLLVYFFGWMHSFHLEKRLVYCRKTEGFSLCVMSFNQLTMETLWGFSDIPFVFICTVTLPSAPLVIPSSGYYVLPLRFHSFLFICGSSSLVLFVIYGKQSLLGVVFWRHGLQAQGLLALGDGPRQRYGGRVREGESCRGKKKTDLCIMCIRR